MITIPGTIPIRIYPIFWLIAAMIGWMYSFTVLGTLAFVVVVFFSVLIHEFGHALTAMAFGRKAEIELVALGGVTLMRGTKLKLWKEFLVVLNGPLAGFMIFLVAYQFEYLLHTNISEFAKFLLGLTIYANLFWTILNLLPIHPLDGGKLLIIVLEGIFGVRGISFGLITSSVLALVVSIYFFLIQAMLGGAIFLLFAFESFRAWQSSRKVTSKDQDEAIQLMLKQAEETWQSGDKEEAKRQLEDIRRHTQNGLIYNTSTEDLAEILNDEGKSMEAYELLAPLEKHLSPDGFKLLHQLAFHNHMLEATIALGDRAYQVYPGYETALINAQAYSLFGKEIPAVGWLQRAIGDGLPDIHGIFKRTEFDPIRSFPPFQELEQRYR